jgi:outer membrane protein TolC
MRRTIGSLALLAVLLIGRTAGAQRRPAAPPAGAHTGQPQPAAAPAPAMPVTPEVDDPMLAPVPRPSTEISTWEDALKFVRARSTDLRIAVEQVVRAEAASRIALAGALPTLNASGDFTHNFIFVNSTGPTGAKDAAGTPIYKTVGSPYPSYFNGSALLTQPVLALRAWYNIGTASRNEDIARLSVEDAKRTIALNVANAIVGVVTAERLAELNRVGLRNALARLDLAQRKSTLGSGTGLDVVRARQDVETARATLVSGDESLRQAREALGLALGLPEQVGVPPSVNLDGLDASARQACRAVGDVNERPDIAALRGKVEVAHRQVNDVKLQFLPTVDLRSTLASTTQFTGLRPATTWNLMAVLTVPIFDGGIRYGNLRDTHAQEAIAGENLEAARRKAQIEVTQAKRGVAVAEDRRKVAVAARDLAADNDRLTRSSYQEGRGTSLELITAAQGLREAEIQLALRDFELVKARVLAILALASCSL